jgi:2,3-bisphosphoglycerate-independent phosphoglycerate mutase
VRKLVVVAPDWLGENPERSPFEQGLPALEELESRSNLARLAPTPPAGTVEAAFLGMDPASVNLSQGALTVAALGFDPPERSVHFHLSLASFVEGRLRFFRAAPPEVLVSSAFREAAKLNTKRLTVLPGTGLDHALVWEEGSLDMATCEPSGAEGKPVGDCVPEGDGELLLRRFIDDSVNLLAELPANVQRLDEGEAPISVLWPWGQGFRDPVPNLALLPGEIVWVMSGSLRLQGLTRLTGYRHSDRMEFGTGTNVRLERIVEAAKSRPATIAVIESLSQFAAKKMAEESAWLTRELDGRLLAPLLPDVREGLLSLVIASPRLYREANTMIPIAGLALTSAYPAGPGDPGRFHEESLDDRRYGIRDLWQVVEEALA